MNAPIEFASLALWVVAIVGLGVVPVLLALSRTMSSAIESRDAEIRRGKRELRRVLDTVAAGFVTVDCAGRMAAERSRILEQWFGPAKGDGFFDYVETFAPVAAHVLESGWRELASGLAPRDVILAELPARIETETQTFAFGYAPLLEGDVLVGVIVSITNVTADVRRVEAERAQHEAERAQHEAERAQREAMVVLRGLLDDRAGFTRFIAEGERLLADMRSPSTDRSARMRLLRALQSNAAIYELESIAAACRALEELLADDDVATLSPPLLVKLDTAWTELRMLVAEATVKRIASAA